MIKLNNINVGDIIISYIRWSGIQNRFCTSQCEDYKFMMLTVFKIIRNTSSMYGDTIDVDTNIGPVRIYQEDVGDIIEVIHI